MKQQRATWKRESEKRKTSNKRTNISMDRRKKKQKGEEMSRNRAKIIEQDSIRKFELFHHYREVTSKNYIGPHVFKLFLNLALKCKTFKIISRSSVSGESRSGGHKEISSILADQ
jgi:hypothetical protein